MMEGKYKEFGRCLIGDKVWYGSEMTEKTITQIIHSSNGKTIFNLNNSRNEYTVDSNLTSERMNHGNGYSNVQHTFTTIDEWLDSRRRIIISEMNDIKSSILKGVGDLEEFRKRYYDILSAQDVDHFIYMQKQKL